MPIKSVTIAFLVLLLAACSSSDNDASKAITPDGGTPPAAGYPAGPYGTEVGGTVANFAFQGLSGPDYDPAKPSTTKLSDFYDPSGAGGKKLLVINVCSVWCVACKFVYETIQSKAAEYRAKGVDFVAVLFEDSTFKPIGLPEASAYAKAQKAGFLVAIDPAYQLGGFLKPVEVPVSIVVSARDMKVLGSTGTIKEPDELWRFVDQKLTEIR
jgi:thiol-disulfide isomerase/thioredoxin